MEPRKNLEQFLALEDYNFKKDLEKRRTETIHRMMETGEFM